jgi:hypothetical protein
LYYESLRLITFHCSAHADHLNRRLQPEERALYVPVSKTNLFFQRWPALQVECRGFVMSWHSVRDWSLGQLYDIGFDLPETHVIRKGEGMYYAFFAKQWKGAVELRGLEPRKYRVVD